MKNFICKFFSWIRDHFSLLFKVVFRLDIGGKKKENPVVSNEDETEGGLEE